MSAEEVSAQRVRRQRKITQFLKDLPFIVLITVFGILIIGMTLNVLLSAFAKEWAGTVLPNAYTFHWMTDAWKQYDIAEYFKVSLIVTTSATLLALILSLPGAYVLARKEFPLKSLLTSFYRLPFMLPELTYALPIASIFYSIGLAETVPGLILANLLIGIPFSIFIIIPFIEALDPRLEVAAQSLGATKLQMFTKIVAPQLVPGLTAAAINIFVRMFGTFIIILLIAGPTTQTLPVMVFSVLSSAGSQPQAMIDSLTISLMLPLLIFTFVSLWVSRFVQKKTGK
jgi:putative spermidine/putrescine transport system permease protein